jgi:DNA processing protein
VGARETAAVLALIARRDLPWSRIAGMLEEEGSALALFDDGERPPSLDELQDRVDEWRAERMRVITILDDDYPVNLRLVHDRPAALFVRGELAPADERSVAVVGTRPTAGSPRRARSRAVSSPPATWW